MKITNTLQLEFPSLSRNIGFSRHMVAVFAMQAGDDWYESDLEEVKLAVSEAVTNAMIHGYDGQEGQVRVTVNVLDDRGIEIIVEDFGIGIADVAQAREPLYTTKSAEERTGLGFTMMESFMDELEVTSEPGKGTVVRMIKWNSLTSANS